jgi:hypothetical protein
VPVTVKFVAVAELYTVVALPIKTISPVAPNANVLTIELFVLKTVQVKVLLSKLKVLEPCTKFALNVIEPPSVIAVVFAACMLMDISDKFPEVVAVPPPELPSKIAASATPGADAPAAPPDVADQLAVLDESQVPEPPTQNRLAIICAPVADACTLLALLLAVLPN